MGSTLIERASSGNDGGRVRAVSGYVEQEEKTLE